MLCQHAEVVWEFVLVWEWVWFWSRRLWLMACGVAG